MTNSNGNFATLQDASGIVADSSQSQVAGIVLKSALTGSLTITGVRNVDGTAASWVISAASSGWQAPTGNSSGLCGALSYSYSNVGADAGKALLMWTPR